MEKKIGLIKSIGRLIVLPEQVDKLEQKIDRLQEKCVSHEELSAITEAQDDKLDLVIELLKNNEK